MTDLFLKVLNLSFSATWVVLAVVLARLVLKKAPRSLVCALWALVALRLVFGGIEAPFSLIPSAQIIPPDSLFDQAPMIDSGISSIDNLVNPVYSESLRPMPGASVNPLQVWLAVYALLWVLGMAAMALWAVISCLRVRRRIRESVCEGGVHLCDQIASPFIFGLFRPKIYLPSELDGPSRTHVLAHEQAHIARRDHWWKPLGFALLTVNWFNPAMWLAYILLCRDIEMACDERVIRSLGTEEKKAYSAALLRCSVNARPITACPLAFGEVGVKQRIKSVLHYKKPAFWVILMAAVLICVLALGLLTDPAVPDQSPPETTAAPTETEESDLGISLHLENVTRNGATLVCTQSGGQWEHIITGSPYNLERYEDDRWVSVMPESTIWTAIAYMVNQDMTTSWPLNWSQIVGSLAPGRYRVSKTFSARQMSPFGLELNAEEIQQTCYAEFIIE